MQLYLEGLLFGVVPVFFVGPVMFTLLHASLRDGFWAGATVALGITVSDVVAIALCALGVGKLLTQSWGQSLMELVGGVILVGFGLAMTLGTVHDPEAPGPKVSGKKLFASGFLVNFVNPFVFTFWIGSLGGVSSRHGFSPNTVTVFFAGVITMIFATDLAKARLAEILKKRLTKTALSWSSRVSGVALGGCGVYLLVEFVAKVAVLFQTT